MKYLIYLMIFCYSCSTTKQNLPEVEIRKDGNSYNLFRNGEPYFIKGAVGLSFLERLENHGANSVRLWRNFGEGLDLASKHNLSVLISLPVRAERDGMDYDNPQMVVEQFEKIMEIVQSIKNHPALLMWAIGNELDYIPGTLPYKLSVWDAVNQIAKAIHEIDPDHPVMTVVGDSMFEKIRDLNKRAPDLDLLGLNMYGAMYKIPELLRENGWEKPYVFTEWGVSGYWEVPKSSWKAPYEEHTSEKAELYKNKYENIILREKENCLGSYVFLWGWKQETTHTWFGMIDQDGLESEAVGVMHEMWMGASPNNFAPRIDSLSIDNLPYLVDIISEPGSIHKAAIVFTDPDSDQVEIKWEIRHEAIYAAYAGQGEKTPELVEGLIKQNGKKEIIFSTPEPPGPYRIYVYMFDDQGHYATANKPFYSGNPVEY